MIRLYIQTSSLSLKKWLWTFVRHGIAWKLDMGLIIPKSLNLAQIDIDSVQKSWLILKVSYYIWTYG
jgi:hypothetical protein